jgi:hypothetical protein
MCCGDIDRLEAPNRLGEVYCKRCDVFTVATPKPTPLEALLYIESMLRRSQAASHAEEQAALSVLRAFVLSNVLVTK